MDYRLYKSEDFVELYAIEEECFQPPFRFSRRYMRHLVQSSESITWIAEKDGRMAGFAIAAFTEESDGVAAYVEPIEVIPAQRERGVGGQLLQRIEYSARAMEAGLLWLHVEAGNASAMRLYEGQGYQCVGSEEDFYAPDRGALIYRKPLDAEMAG